MTKYHIVAAPTWSPERRLLLISQLVSVTGLMDSYQQVDLIQRIRALASFPNEVLSANAETIYNGAFENSIKLER